MKDNKKKSASYYLVFVFSIAIGVLIGLIISPAAAALEACGIKFSLLIIVGCIILSAFVHIIIHEGGHLIFGLISGYKFGSFRILNTILIRQGKKLKLKKFHLSGTLGQCLMIPPPIKDEKKPTLLYNFGGVFVNLIFSIIAIVCATVWRDIPPVVYPSTIFAIIGIYLAVHNDGYNAVSMIKDQYAAKALYIQLLVQNEVSNGTRIKDMPSEWFIMPSDEQLKNNMLAAQAVFCCNRLMDEHKFAEADETMAHILSIESSMAAVHRMLCICDRIYCRLLAGDSSEQVSKLLTSQQIKLMEGMKSFPSVLRTQYAIAMLSEKNTQKADKIKNRFESIAKKYPYPADIETEREMILMVDKCFQKLSFTSDIVSQ